MYDDFSWLLVRSQPRTLSCLWGPPPIQGLADGRLRLRYARFHAHWRHRMQGPCVCSAATISTHLCIPRWALTVMRATETAHWLEWQGLGQPNGKNRIGMSGGQLHIPNRGPWMRWDENAVKYLDD